LSKQGTRAPATTRNQTANASCKSPHFIVYRMRGVMPHCDTLTIAQRNLQSAQVDRRFNARASAQFQNDSLPVPQPTCCYPAWLGDCRIHAVDIRRTPHIVGATNQVYRCRAKGAGAYAPHAQRITLALEAQSAAATTNNELCSGDCDADRTSSRAGL